ncbi:hypothetical protein [Pseudomonas gingeri]|uniref:Uncharacterized protein n=1 Tax=Pseudomonas gingeri TaxID=117681 RepID=A0A7Y7YKK3_9PSED|nr:hypothetical protein [Pseudomonas gingeri]NWB32091.1 hypothetical protein [Pseudomonas gingeri]NWC37529.1 hypothetical protein [Pseudomonas gingeri]
MPYILYHWKMAISESSNLPTAFDPAVAKSDEEAKKSPPHSQQNLLGMFV